jgi:Zn-finger domain-containing protein
MNYLFIKIGSSYLITTLERVEVAATSNNIAIVILKAMANYM